MRKAGVFVTALLAVASLGMLAQETHPSAGAPSAASQAGQNVNQPATPQAPSQAAQSNSASAPVRGPVQTDPVADAQTGNADMSSSDGVSNQQLPQTSTILPLLGLIGLGSLVAGLFARR
jgi:hypothetical protein